MAKQIVSNGIHIVNPGAAEGRYLLSFGGFSFAGEEKLLIWADSLESALDEMVDYVEAQWPQYLANGAVNEAYAEAYAEAIAQGHSEEDAECIAQDEALVDVLVGDNGNFIHGEDWRILAEDPEREEILSLAS